MNKKRQEPLPLTPEEEGRKALQTALNIVAYRDNTEARLRQKLRERGYSAEVVENTVLYLKERNLLNDERMLTGAVRSMATGKLYGKERIRQELLGRGFSRDTVSSICWEGEELADLDFSLLCLRLLKKRGGTRDEKTYAFLRRYGHSPRDIRAAYTMLAEESDSEADDDGFEADDSVVDESTVDESTVDDSTVDDSTEE